jgi:hypothetical protein
VLTSLVKTGPRDECRSHYLAATNPQEGDARLDRSSKRDRLSKTMSWVEEGGRERLCFKRDDTLKGRGEEFLYPSNNRASSPFPFPLSDSTDQCAVRTWVEALAYQLQ